MKNFKKLFVILMAVAIMMLAVSCNLISGQPNEVEHLHELTEVAEVAATCTNAGVKAYYTCSGCDKLFADAEGATEITAPEAIEKLAHTEEIVPGKAATCTEKGLTEGKICSVCETVLVAQDEIALADHTEKVVPGKAATCTEKGLTEGKICSVCEAVLEAQTEIALAAHSEEVVSGKAATCTEKGLTDGKICSVCEAVLVAQEEIPMAAHTEEVVSGKAATCTEKGLTDGKKCSVCKAILVAQTEIGVIPHTEEVIPGKAATCTETGLTDGKKCSVCKAILVEQAVIAVKDHKDDNGDFKCDVCTADLCTSHVPAAVVKENAKAATCTEAGSYDNVVRCSICNAIISSETVTVAALGHSEIILEGKDATCTATGLTEGKKCTVCQTVTVAQTVIPVAAHTEEVIPGKAATCTAAGLTEGKKCSVCGAIILAQTEIPVADHTEEILPGKAATCTATGLTEGKKCSVCETVTVAQTVIPVASHTEEVIPGKAATCTAAGLTEGKKCSVCGATILAQTEIPMADHTEEVLPGKAATCTATGLTDGKKCSVCGVTLVAQEEIPMTNHTEEIIPAKDATCSEEGLTEGKKCSVCNAVLVEQESIGVIDHTAGEAVQENVVPGNCQSTGSYDSVVKCSACGAEMSRETIITEKADHVFGDAFEGEDGFYHECQVEGCGYTEATDVPVKDYKAVVDNSFASSKKNSHVFQYSDGYNAYDIITNGSYKLEIDQGSPATGGIGGLDKTGRYVVYEFVLDKPGTVDIIWNVAGTRWQGSLDSNNGITNLTNCGTLTIDGKAIDVNGVKLPGGSGTGTGTSVWWNLNNVVISGLALDAGAHTFRYETYLENYGLNIASMTVYSDRNISVRNPKITSADISVEGDKTYYVFTYTGGVYDVEELSFWHNADVSYDIASLETVDGVTTIKIDVTDVETGTLINPHLSFAGVNYINGANVNGDVCGNGLAYAQKSVQGSNGKWYVIHTNYSMPSLTVCENYMKIQGADIYAENDKLYYALTYLIANYDPANFEFFDGTTVYAVESIDNKDGLVTFKMDMTGIAAGKTMYPHLRVNGAIWDGATNASSSNGDVKVAITEESVVLNGKVYMMYTYYSMPIIQVVSGSNYMKILGADIYKENNKLYYTLSYRIANYDPSKFEFFDGSTIYAVESYAMNGLTVTFKFNLTDKAAGFNLWPHLRVNGKNWDGATNASSSNGDVKVAVTTETITLNGKTYTLKAQYDMPTVVVS